MKEIDQKIENLYMEENQPGNPTYAEKEQPGNPTYAEKRQREDCSYAKENQIGNRFLIQDQWAKGGMSKIFLAQDLHLGKKVIVKISSVQETLQEARLLSEIKHPAFPTILDLYQDEKEIILVMEYINGMTLREYIEQEGPLPEEQAMHIGIQILDALTYLHSRRSALIYQDLKPENIMIQKDGTARMIDLGAAVQHAHDGKGIVSMGTKGYASPEQENGDVSEIDVQSDIYTFGAVLYSMVTGIFLNMPPYRMDPVEQMCPELSDKLVYIIERSTEKEKRKRFGSAAEIEQIWKTSGNIKKKYKRKASLLYIRREKSIFLSAKKYAGLWMCFLCVILGVCLFPYEYSMQSPYCIAGTAGVARSLVHRTEEVVYLDICECRYFPE